MRAVHAVSALPAVLAVSALPAGVATAGGVNADLSHLSRFAAPVSRLSEMAPSGLVLYSAVALLRQRHHGMCGVAYDGVRGCGVVQCDETMLQRAATYCYTPPCAVRDPFSHCA